MKQFVLSALALAAAGGFASAGTGSEEWLTLDREIESLASKLTPQDNGNGIVVGGFIRSSYANSGDAVFQPPSSGVTGQDLGGFLINNARLDATATVGDLVVFMSFEGGASPTTSGGVVTSLLAFGTGGGFGLLRGVESASSLTTLDAFAAWNVSEMFTIEMGQFRSPFLASAQRDEDEMLFMQRTIGGEIWDFRDQGVMASGNYDMLDFALAIQNGLDAAGDDLSWSAFVQVDLMGGEPPMTEGAYGMDQGSQFDISGGYYADDDTLVSDVAAFNIGADFRHGPFYAGAELVDYDDFIDQTMWSAQASFMLVPEQFEAAARFEDVDDTDSTEVLTLGVNYYMQGHAAKWQFNYIDISSDTTANEGDAFVLGLTASV